MRTTEICDRPATANSQTPRRGIPWSSELALMWGTTFVMAVLTGITWISAI